MLEGMVVYISFTIIKHEEGCETFFELVRKRLLEQKYFFFQLPVLCLGEYHKSFQGSNFVQFHIQFYLLYNYKETSEDIL